MANDVKMFVACNHVVNEEPYDSSACPRCYGKGFYFDVYFNTDGTPVLTEGSTKLQQEISKIFIDTKGGNVFHPLWGSDIVSRLVGTKNINITQSKLEVIVKDVIAYLKSVQESDNSIWNNMSPEEMVDQVISVELVPQGPTGYLVRVLFSNKVGDVSSQTFIM